VRFQIGPWKVGFLLYIVVVTLALFYGLYLVIRYPKKYTKWRKVASTLKDGYESSNLLSGIN